MILDLLRKSWQVAVGSRERAVCYRYEPARQGTGKRDPAIQVFDSGTPPPAGIRRQMTALAGRLGYWEMWRRTARHGGKLLCLLDGSQVVAYGWTQGWAPFRRRYGWLAQEAVMLGPYWTAPAHRGRGLYGRLLAHSIAVCNERDDMPLLIMTSQENRASQRGIHKAGFRQIAAFERANWFFRLINTHRAVAWESTVGEGGSKTPPAGRAG